MNNSKKFGGKTYGRMEDRNEKQYIVSRGFPKAGHCGGLLELGWYG